MKIAEKTLEWNGYQNRRSVLSTNVPARVASEGFRFSFKV